MAYVIQIPLPDKASERRPYVLYPPVPFILSSDVGGVPQKVDFTKGCLRNW
jgi:hypothetical protein